MKLVLSDLSVKHTVPHKDAIMKLLLNILLNKHSTYDVIVDAKIRH